MPQGAKRFFYISLFHFISSLSGTSPSDQLLEQTVLGTEPQQAAMAYSGKANLKVPLGVEPAQHQCFPSEQSQKADIVVLGHGVV